MGFQLQEKKIKNKKESQGSPAFKHWFLCVVSFDEAAIYKGASLGVRWLQLKGS